MNNYKPELLAPAGDYTCFQAALRAGADAVYIGGDRYGARAYAGNFSGEEVIRALREAHFYGRKVYLTVNTLMKQRELDQLLSFLEPFYREGLDGVIIQDVGAASLIGRHFPNLPLHASTQMTITDARSAKALKELGMTRIVPARELSLEEIKQLKQETGLEVETFIHGAMCYCYSGQCLFSSLLGGRSGNRGRCAQPCRQPYRIRLQEQVGKECYPLSLKDMCTIDLIPALLEAGIDSFKIEGRMKKPEYVAGVTDVYRRRIDDFLRYGNRTVPDKDRRLLSVLYIRTGVGSGYYEKHNGADMITLKQPGYAGCEDSVLGKIRTGIMARETGIRVSLRIRLKKGSFLYLEAEDEDGNRTSAAGMEVQQARKQPLSEEDIRKQLEKTGGTGFTVSNVQTEMDEDIFLPVKAINELRRTVLDKLKKIRVLAGRPYEPVILDENVAGGQTARLVQEDRRKKSGFRRHATVSSVKQLEACLLKRIERIYVPASSLGTDMEDALRSAAGKGAELFLALPLIWRRETEKELAWLERLLRSGLFDGVQASCPAALTWLSEKGWEGKTALDHRIYIWNRETWGFWERYADTYCAPLELNRSQLYELPEKGKEILVYGRIPMMVTANCVRKTAGSCLRERNEKNGYKEAALIDRYHAEFPVMTDCRFCYNVIYNSVPLSLHNYTEDLQEHQICNLRFDFLEESAEDIIRILELFERGSLGDTENERKSIAAAFPAGFTTGHFKKGAL